MTIKYFVPNIANKTDSQCGSLFKLVEWLISKKNYVQSHLYGYYQPVPSNPGWPTHGSWKNSLGSNNLMPNKWPIQPILSIEKLWYWVVNNWGPKITFLFSWIKVNGYPRDRQSTVHKISNTYEDVQPLFGCLQTHF